MLDPGSRTMHDLFHLSRFFTLRRFSLVNNSPDQCFAHITTLSRPFYTPNFIGPYFFFFQHTSTSVIQQ